MELNIAVVDDEPADSVRLRSFIRSWASSGEHILGRMEIYPSGEDMLRSFVPRAFNVVFMDIIMRGINGVDTARRLRLLDSDVLIVFLSTSREFAFEVFPVHVFDYIIKPCTMKNVDRVLSEAVRLLDAYDPKVTLKVSRTEYTLPVRLIISAVSHGHNVEVNLTDGRCLVSAMTFREMQEVFSSHRSFILCNKGVLVNMLHVASLKDGVFIMRNGAQYPLKVRGQAKIKQAFSQYLIDNMRYENLRGGGGGSRVWIYSCDTSLSSRLSSPTQCISSCR